MLVVICVLGGAVGTGLIAFTLFVLPAVFTGPVVAPYCGIRKPPKNQP